MSVVNLVVEESPAFDFTIPGTKKKWRLPAMDDLPIGIRQTLSEVAKPIRDANESGRKPSDTELEALGEAQLKLLDKYCPGLKDSASTKALAVILRTWAEHSGIDLGE